MTPRESLNKILEASLEAGGITNLENITEPFAIGRWVSVDERLPKFKDRKWKGIFKRDDVEYAGVFNFNEFLSGDEWLDLSMPSGKGEA